VSLLSNLIHKKSQPIGIHRKEEKAQRLDSMNLDQKVEKSSVIENDGFKEDHKDEQEIYEVVEREIHPAKIICPDCGGITLEGLEFCDKCGGELV